MSANYAAGAANMRSGADDFSDVDAMFTRLIHARSDQRRRYRDQIIDRCMPLADHIAYKFVGRGEPIDDLLQVARLGLVNAVDRFDPDKGRLLAFAVPTIMGHIRRYFRDNTWAMHVPRSLKEGQHRVHAAVGTLSQRLGRAPTATEVAAELGIDRQDVVNCFAAAYAYQPMSLDAPQPGCESPHQWRHGAEFYDPEFGRVEDAMTAAALVGQLTEDERAILTMRFQECLTQTQIAQRIGVSQVQVSRLLADILRRLRRNLLTERLVVCR